MMDIFKEQKAVFRGQFHQLDEKAFSILALYIMSYIVGHVLVVHVLLACTFNSPVRATVLLTGIEANILV